MVEQLLLVLVGHLPHLPLRPVAVVPPRPDDGEAVQRRALPDVEEPREAPVEVPEEPDPARRRAPRPAAGVGRRARGVQVLRHGRGGGALVQNRKHGVVEAVVSRPTSRTHRVPVHLDHPKAAVLLKKHHLLFRRRSSSEKSAL